MSTSATLPGPSAPAGAGPLMDSSATMLSNLPTGFMDDFMSDSDPAPDSDPEPDPVADPEPDTEPEPEPDTDTEPEPDQDPEPEPGTETEPEPGTDPDPTAQATDELPEGVTRGKDRGKNGVFVEDNRFKKIYDNHKMVNEVSEAIGEPLTREALDLRNEAYLAQERMFNNLTSGDPAAQGQLVNFFLDEMKAAHDTGETGVDPAVPFATAMYDSLREKAPEAYSALRLKGAIDMIGEMFNEAATSKDGELGASAQRLAMKIAGVGPKPANMTEDQYLAHIRQVTQNAGIPFHSLAELEGLVRPETELIKLQRENAELRAKGKPNPVREAANAYNTWNADHKSKVNTAIEDNGVLPSLSAVKDQWSKFPDDYKVHVTEPLTRAVTTALNSDPVFNQRIAGLQTQSRRATTAEARDRFGVQIQTLMVNRAKMAAEKAAPAILKTAANFLAFRSQGNHERRAGAQARTTPQGTSSPVRHSVLPDSPKAFSGGVYTPAEALQQALKAMR